MPATLRSMDLAMLERKGPMRAGRQVLGAAREPLSSASAADQLEHDTVCIRPL